MGLMKAFSLRILRTLVTCSLQLTDAYIREDKFSKMIFGYIFFLLIKIHQLLAQDVEYYEERIDIDFNDIMVVIICKIKVKPAQNSCDPL